MKYAYPFSREAGRIEHMYRYIIIDDESLIRKGTIKKLEALQDQAVCCGEAANGREGIELIEEVAPDFVILDMNMPVMG